MQFAASMAPSGDNHSTKGSIMQADPDTLRYHGRRSIDELIGAVNADTIAVALVHKRLSLLHLDRLVSAITAAADAIHPRPSRQSATMPAEADQRPAL